MRFLSDKRFTRWCGSSHVFLCVLKLFACFHSGKDKTDFYEQIPIMLRDLLYRFMDENDGVLKATHGALGALSTHVPAEELVKHIEFIRNLLGSMVSDARRRKGGVGDGEFFMPGFNVPKGKFFVRRLTPSAK
jgi:hypothetical protein